MAFPVVADAVATAQTTNSTSWTIDVPAHNAGDLLILAIGMDGAPTINSLSAVGGTDAWTQRGNAANGTANRLAVYRCRATASRAASTVTLSLAATEQGVCRCLRITGAHPTTEVAISASATGSSTTPNPAALDPADWATEDTLWIAYCNTDAAVTATAAPASFDNLFSDVSGGGNGAGLHSARREQAVSSQDPGTFTLSATETWVAFTVGIRPAPAPVVASGTNTVAVSHSIGGVAIAEANPAGGGGSATFVAGKGDDGNFTIPAGAAAGDVAVALVMGVGIADAPIEPSGWTWLDSNYDFFTETGAALAAKVLSSGDLSATHSWDLGGGGGSTVVLVYSGANLPSIFNTLQPYDFSIDPVAQSDTPSNTGIRAILYAGSNGGVSWGEPAGVTERVDTGGVGGSDEPMASGVSEPSRTFTPTFSVTSWIGSAEIPDAGGGPVVAMVVVTHSGSSSVTGGSDPSDAGTTTQAIAQTGAAALAEPGTTTQAITQAGADAKAEPGSQTATGAQAGAEALAEPGTHSDVAAQTTASEARAEPGTTTQTIVHSTAVEAKSEPGTHTDTAAQTEQAAALAEAGTHSDVIVQSGVVTGDPADAGTTTQAIVQAAASEALAEPGSSSATGAHAGAPATAEAGSTAATGDQAGAAASAEAGTTTQAAAQTTAAVATAETGTTTASSAQAIAAESIADAAALAIAVLHAAAEALAAAGENVVDVAIGGGTFQHLRPIADVTTPAAWTASDAGTLHDAVDESGAPDGVFVTGVAS